LSRKSSSKLLDCNFAGRAVLAAPQLLNSGFDVARQSRFPHLSTFSRERQ
jgi:hypothetical protein